MYEQTEDDGITTNVRFYIRFKADATVVLEKTALTYPFYFLGKMLA